MKPGCRRSAAWNPVVVKMPAPIMFATTNAVAERIRMWRWSPPASVDAVVMERLARVGRVGGGTSAAARSGGTANLGRSRPTRK